MSDTDKDQIIESLTPLFAAARASGMWFYGSYHQLWFSPSELEAAQKTGNFVWGPKNWILRDPKEALQSLDKKIEGMQSERNSLAARIAESAK